MDGVLLDGVLGVNILLKPMYIQFGSKTLPFHVKMADQKRLQPLGILKDQEIHISSLKYKVNFVVVEMHTGTWHTQCFWGDPGL